MLAKLSALAWIMIAVPGPASSCAAVNASVVVTSFADPLARASSELRSPLAGWVVCPGTWKCPPAEKKSPAGPRVGATEFGSHLPTAWMCIPWKPGVRMPSPIVSTVRVAKPPVKSNVPVAAGLPSAVDSWAVSFCPSPFAGWEVDADGDVDPVQTGGLVPGEVLGFWCGLQALSPRAGTANRTAATAAGLTMAQSLSRDRHEQAGRQVGDFGPPKLHRRIVQDLAHLAGSLSLARGFREEHGRHGHVGQLERARLDGDVPAGLRQPLTGARRRTLHPGDVVDVHVGLRRGGR